ncbi:cystathionine gamma-synthase [Permianibacter sp. IMCC34836]|uniref:cystathionine gamma-synthase n=1 Tax=Permianibacter fluminis TaxID=2738515 RepID=UPI001552B014|nr:cystathionine gamma-synthase [Permianibacter fluminis]NQD37802.1 cystathionine gamma-synthase [Permianibacter fluminis]
MSKRCRPATRLVRAGIETDKNHNAVIPPIYLSTNFAFTEYGQKPAYDYTRSGNPTRDLLGEALADLEGGAGGVITATGMAAITLVLQLLKPDDLVIAPHDCYGGSYRLLFRLKERGVVNAEFHNQYDDGIYQLIAERKPKLLWIETPSNPLLRIADIQKLADAAHAVGALVVVDNTFLSPALQQPIALGADIVVHSTTKYINGHSDVVGGAAIAKTRELHEKLVFWANCLGLTASPFDSYLALRGLRTLEARLSVHLANTEAVIEVLTNHRAVKKVYYPGLPNHPGHDIAKRQQSDFGAMLSFELHGGEHQVRTLLDNLQHFSLAESLGGVESLIAHPASMTHLAMDPEARRRAGISDTLLRVSVGIEDAEDLCGALEDALDAVLETPALEVVNG